MRLPALLHLHRMGAGLSRKPLNLTWKKLGMELKTSAPPCQKIASQSSASGYNPENNIQYVTRDNACVLETTGYNRKNCQVVIMKARDEEKGNSTNRLTPVCAIVDLLMES